jgi:hypothetical protein
MNVILKKEIPISDNFFLSLPKNANILCFKTQNEVPMIWYEFETSEIIKQVKRKFCIIRTGDMFFKGNLIYIGTILQKEDLFVWHLYEDKNL